jgi:antitoxin (DNA-binding transcriptional repressor) of toxin-antitoxin stability system
MLNMSLAVTEHTPDIPVRRVGIRELQQHAARVIKELTEAEEAAEITSRGKVIARLIPVSPAEQAFLEMIDRGEIIPAKNAGGLVGWQPLPPRPDDRSLSDELIAMREEERW